jgi:hypothetical protein
VIDEQYQGEYIVETGQIFRGILAETNHLILELGDVLLKDFIQGCAVEEVGLSGPGAGTVIKDDGKDRRVAEALAEARVEMGGVHLFLVIVQDEGDVLEHFKTEAEVDFGLVLYDGDDKEGALVFEIDTLYGVRFPAFLKEGDIADIDILNILRTDVFQDVDRDEILKKLDKKLVVSQDLLEAVVFWGSNGHGCLHIVFYISIWVEVGVLL